MSYLFGTFISLSLPFVGLWLWWQCFAWWMQRIPPSRRTMANVEKLGPPPPPIRLVDARGNVRHEWAADLVQQRLRNIESQQRAADLPADE